jgi:hypothetical protein
MMSLNLFLFKIKLSDLMGKAKNFASKIPGIKHLVKYEEKQDKPKNLTSGGPQYYVITNIGQGESCEYASKLREMSGGTVKDKDGKETSITHMDATSETLRYLGLPTSISYFVPTCKLFVPEDVKIQLETNEELRKKFNKAFGVEEKKKLQFEKL